MVGAHVLPCETRAAQKPAKADEAGIRWVLPATILGSSIGSIDSSVVNVAPPAMQGSFDTSLGTLQWMINKWPI